MTKKLMILAAAVAVAFGAWAEEETVGGYTWTYQINGGTAEIHNPYKWAAISPMPTGSVTVPSTLDGKPVTSIGDGAFNGCSDLTRVVIPNSVTSIGEFAFYECSSLTSVTIPDSVTSIGYGAFEFCGGLTSVTIPDSVTSIGDSAFYGCSRLRSFVVSPENLSYQVNAGLLLTKDGKTIVAVPEGIWGALTIPDGVTSIGNSVFRSCRGLTSVTIPNSVTSIEDFAFSGCRGLTNVTIPDSVTNIGYRAFEYCSGLKSFVVSTDNPSYQAISGLLLTKDGALVAVPGGLSGVLTIPDGVTSIEDGAVWSCSWLRSVTIPNSMTNIGAYAFSDCSGLTSVIFQGDAPSVHNYAFHGVNSSCTAYVLYDSTNWGVMIPGRWRGITIRYYGGVITFNLSDNGTCTGGGALEQMVDYQAAAVAPEVVGNEGWEFLGWDADFSCVISNMTVNAIWRRVYEAGEAVGADAQSASLPWMVGTNGVAAAKGYDDATVEGGKSLKFTAVDDASVWVETVVTNACRVSFDWKSSCEPLVKGRAYDYLLFAVDGEQQGFVCGETGWTSVTNYVTGAGEHVLRWTFLRDEDGSSGEDCAWLANVKVTPSVTLTFADGGATAGAVLEPITAYADENIALPGQGSLAWPKHSFVGWSNGVDTFTAGTVAASAVLPDGGTSVSLTAVWEANTLSAPVITAPATYEAESCTVTISADGGATIYYTLDGSEPGAARSESAPYQGAFTVAGSVTVKAIAVRDDYFDSAVATATVTRLTWTFGEYLNWPVQTFTTGGDAVWTRVKGVSEDGYALRSGVITHSQTSRLETVASGAGTIRFACKVEGEIIKKVVWDGLAFCIDGVQQGDLLGNTAWATNTFTVEGTGTHTFSWLYVKDEEGDGDGADCAWLDCVTWTPSGVTVDAGGGKSVTMPGAWLADNTTRAATDVAANGRKVWECYVLGLDPEIATNDFRITSFPLKADGTPDIEHVAFDPPQNRWNVSGAWPVLKGAANLSDTEWPEVTEGNKGLFRFFKVEVVLP